MLADTRFQQDRYLLVRQFFKLLGANFRIMDTNGNLVLFVHQKAFKLRESIAVYTGEDKTQQILSIGARQILDFSAAYDVVDVVRNEKVGALKRKGLHSIVKDTWIVMDANDQEIGQIVEDQMILALVRRFLSNLVPQSFDIVVHGTKVADLRQHFNPFVYKLDIDFSADTGRRFDRRLGIAAAILITAIEGRQG
jgi:uncharacterized protein YxjI